MQSCYYLILRLYYFLIRLTSPFNRKAALWIKGRKNWEVQLSKHIKKNESWIWFHCASLGEFEDACEVFFKLKQSFSTKKTILTVFSPSAFEVLKNTKYFDLIFYLPLDTPIQAKKFISLLKPEFAVFSRSELWFNFLNELSKKNIPAFLISLRLSKNSNFLKSPFKNWYRNCFNSFDFIFCQDSETKHLLESNFSYKSTIFSGNTRFERIQNQSMLEQKLTQIEEFAASNFVIVFGSSLPREEKMFYEIYPKLKAFKIKWILVPHEPEKSSLHKMFGADNCILYSEMNKLTKFHDILIIDTVGLLKTIYKYANFAIIGGGFNRIGIHNIIEPAVYGVPVAFGPNHKNYSEANYLLQLGAASIFTTSDELLKIIKQQVFSPTPDNLKLAIKQFVDKDITASSRIVDTILSKIHRL
ncbi:MAG: hypothetical protein IPP32_10485 [Bacteroidetes bacterium]|nr:hypothetical protein [Bacteroidota bacterium]